MAKGKTFRKLIIPAAARAAVQIIEQRGISCVIVGETAAFLQGCDVVPQNVRLAILPTTPRTLSKDIGTFLTRADPRHFKHTKLKNRVNYYDFSGLIPEGSQNFRQVRWTVANPPPSYFLPEHVVRVSGLPVVDMLVTVVEFLQQLLDRYDEVAARSESQPTGEPSIARKWPKPTQEKQLKRLLRTTVHIGTRSIDEEYDTHAVGLLRRLLELAPQFTALAIPILRVLAPNEHFVAPTLSPDRHSDSDSNSSTDEDAKEAPPEARNAQVICDLHSTPPSLPFSNQVSAATRRPGVASVEDLYKSVVVNGQPATALEVLQAVAGEVVVALAQLDIKCALFGSMACSLYGNKRTPNDVDILTLPTDSSFQTTEWLKKKIANSKRQSFVLQKPSDPLKTFKVLYFQLPRGLVAPGTFRGNKVKVDILIPGVMHLPSLTAPQISWIKNLPVVPFSVLLLQKFQGWDDHRKMYLEPLKYAKRLVDADDIKRLLALSEQVEPLRTSRPWRDISLFDSEFQEATIERVRQFEVFFPEVESDVILLGLVEDA